MASCVRSRTLPGWNARDREDGALIARFQTPSLINTPSNSGDRSPSQTRTSDMTLERAFLRGTGKL